MKTDFSILWVDDNQEFIDALRSPLESWMDEHGFALIVHAHKSEAGILDDLRKKDIELIVIDYKLPKKKGDLLIGEIRGKNFYQDIVFYSQGGIPDDVIKIPNEVFRTPPDGVFFVDRGDAKDRIKDLITLKIRRASDLATLRGWIVADAIELETLLGRVLAKCFGEREVLFTTCVLLHEGLFDFYKKHMVLNSLLHDRMTELARPGGDSATLTKVKACKKVLDAFSDEVVHIRNALAHQVAEVGETGHKKVKVKGRTKEFLNTPENFFKFEGISGSTGRTFSSLNR